MGVVGMSDNGARRYCDFLGRILFVSPGLTNGSTWMTCYVRENGSLKRVKSKFLPLRDSREAAQRDLDRWATERGMVEVGEE